MNELTDRYVAMWNETNTARRNQYVRELWSEDGIECTAARETRGYEALEARVTASHEKMCVMPAAYFGAAMVPPVTMVS